MMRLLSITAVLIALHPAGQVRSSSIEGAVVHGPSSQPFRGAVVRLIPANSTPGTPIVLPVETDSSGVFRFAGVSPDAYRIRVFAQGFGQQEYGARSGARGIGTGTILDIAPGQSLSGIQVRLNAAGVVSGRLVNTGGEPLVGMEIVLLHASHDEFGERVFFPEAAGFTDERGEYRLDGVAPGKYRVCAGSLSINPAILPTASNAPGGGAAVASRPPAASPGTYSLSCYPGRTNPEQATEIQVSAETEIRALDFQLVRQSLYRVRGRVIASETDKVPNPPPQVGILVRHPIFSATYRRRPVAPDGTFEIVDVAPGSYLVTAVVPVPLKPLTPTTPAGKESPPPPAHGAVAISVVNSDINDIVITIVPGVSVLGRIAGDEESLPQATVNAIELTLQRTGTGGERGMSVVQSSAIRPDGSFEFNRLTEGVDYRLLVAKLPPGLYVRQANRANVDLLKESFQPYGSAADSIQVVLSSKGGQVEGVVTDKQVVPVAKAQVVLVPVPADGQHHRFAVTTTDAAGQFAARNLAPGDYRVFAWRELEPFAYFDEELLKRFQNESLSIHVTESSLVKTTVRVIEP